MENTIEINDAAMEDPLIPIEKKNNTDAEETDMTEKKKINTAAIKETGPSYVDECVQVYDSLSSGLSANVDEQLARIYGRLDKSEEDRGLTLHHVPVQQQSDITDCGVFATMLQLEMN